MSSVCWLEDRDDRLARARALAETDPVAALALVDGVLAEVPDDPEALRARGAVLVDVADAERDARRALAVYDEAISLLQRAARPADPDLTAAQRGRAAALRQLAA
jgi:regulator of sirC expression with transglutaminase-like and TPR domain